MWTRGTLAAVVLLATATTGWAGPVLDRVRQGRTLACGVISVPEDYGKADVHGTLDDFGSDLCRAVAVAAIGVDARMAVRSFPDERHGFDAVSTGKVDVLFGASPSGSAEITHGLKFGRPMFYDAEGVLVRRDNGIASFSDLAGKPVCFIGSTHGEDVLHDEEDKRGVKTLPFPFEEDGEMNVALLRDHCAAIISSVSRLANTRASFHAEVKDFVVLPDRLSVEPMAPAVADGDPQWAAVVDATMNALLLAEAAHVGKADAGVLRTTEDPLLRVLGGFVPGVDQTVVDDGWAVRAIAAVGNYGEIYDRDLGPGTGMDLPRGLNALWTQGGLMIPMAPR